jgi:hypothetical protein
MMVPARPMAKLTAIQQVRVFRKYVLPPVVTSTRMNCSP